MILDSNLGHENGRGLKLGRRFKKHLLQLAMMGTSLASVSIATSWAKAESQITQSYGSESSKCCIEAEDKKVPPGSKNGPYTCLPDGSWG